MDFDLEKGGKPLKNIKLDNISPLHKTGHTSKGDQRKWTVDDLWYKADYMGYESLAEVLVSELLKKSSFSYSFVAYEFMQAEYGGALLNVCVSNDFLRNGQVLIPLEKLFRQYTGESLTVKLSGFEDIGERIEYLVNQIEEITKIKNFGPYITAMMEIDAFFLNEDRHTNNIAVLYNENTGVYSLSPFFDQGLCLLADTMQDYPLDLSIEQCLQKIEAKPFCTDFDIQLEAAEERYGIQIRFEFTIEDVLSQLAEMREVYPEKICSRVENLFRYQMRKYAYLLKK